MWCDAGFPLSGSGMHLLQLCCMLPMQLWQVDIGTPWIIFAAPGQLRLPHCFLISAGHHVYLSRLKDMPAGGLRRQPCGLFLFQGLH